jgi:hypothetical protein
MKNNSTLIATFTVAAALMSSTALAGVDAGTSAVDGTADRQHVKMLTDKGPVDDIIDWGAIRTRTSTVAEVPLLDFLMDSREMEKDIDYRPFESAAAFAPAEFRDQRNVTLAGLYPDDPNELMKNKERLALVIIPAARLEAYQARSNYLDEDGHVDAPAGRLQLASLEGGARVTADTPTLTDEERLILLKNRKTFGVRTDEYESGELASIDTPLPLGIASSSVADLKARADQLIQENDHTTFHLGEKVDVPILECAGARALCPYDVWVGSPLPDKESIVSDVIDGTGLPVFDMYGEDATVFRHTLSPAD